MILHRFFEESIAQAGFLVGCPAAGEAVVIDPTRDIQPYIDRARAERLRIVGVTETHIHADYVSGSRALARAVGATLYVSGEGGADWQYAFRDEPGVRVLHGGDVIRVGRGRLDVRHTPGHTPEHLTFLLVDEAASAEPVAAFTGDFIFVGDVGRPDLLERAAGHAGTMIEGAHRLWSSLVSLREAHDGLLLYPAHGAGSACGKSLGGFPVTSLGYERRTNWALRERDEAAFVEQVLAGQPEPPAYFAAMKRINREGAAPLAPAPSRLDVLVASHAAGWALVIDTRPADESRTTLLKGSVAVPLDRTFSRWVGSTVPIDHPILLLAANEADAIRAARDLDLVGFERIIGWVGPEYLPATGPRAITTLPEVDVTGLARAMTAGATVVDVRGAAEHRAGAIPGSRNIPLGFLAQEAADVDRSATVVVYCQTGVRSHVAASLLSRLGFRDVRTLGGGYEQYAESLSAAATA